MQLAANPRLPSVAAAGKLPDLGEAIVLAVEEIEACWSRGAACPHGR
jgi:hypothetical protein